MKHALRYEGLKRSLGRCTMRNQQVHLLANVMLDARSASTDAGFM